MSTSDRSYLRLAEHYRACLSRHGDKARGMDWPREADNRRRFGVMADLFAAEAREKRVTVLDFACGTSHFYGYLRARGLGPRVAYSGIDIGPEAVAAARRKYPGNDYRCLDVLAHKGALGRYDYVVINGLFTQKRGMTDRQMKAFLVAVLGRLLPCWRKGLAFNAMSDQVDFRRRGSFHLDLGWAARLLAERFTRDFVVRHDYGLYENTFYLYKGGDHGR